MSDEEKAPSTQPEGKPAWASDFENKLLGAVEHIQETVLAFDTRLKAVEQDKDTPLVIPRYSGRVAALEQTDETVNKRLETLETGMKSLADETKSQTKTLDRILGNPEVKKVLQSLAGLALALIAIGTLAAYQKLAAMQAKAEERQPAPSVTVVPVFMPTVDAGGPDARP